MFGTGFFCPWEGWAERVRENRKNAIKVKADERANGSIEFAICGQQRYEKSNVAFVQDFIFPKGYAFECYSKTIIFVKKLKSFH